jgi:hypothetical protein
MQSLSNVYIFGSLFVYEQNWSQNGVEIIFKLPQTMLISDKPGIFNQGVFRMYMDGWKYEFRISERPCIVLFSI